MSRARTLATLALLTARAAAAPSPSCMMNSTPCPVPVGWAVDWSLRNSTIAMPELAGALNNLSFVPAPGHHWGMVSLDWAVGRGTWLAPDRARSTCEATSAANCAALKASGAVTRCSIYHNIELALEWIESSRAAMYDAARSDWFLQFTDGRGNKNGTVYNQARAEGDQFFIDYRNPAAAAFFIDSIVNATIDLGVDATFTDDRDGVPVEHASLPALLKLSPAEVAALQYATQAAGQRLAEKLAAAGKTCWDCLGGYELGPRPVAGATCAPTMRALCAPAAQARSMLMGYSGREAVPGADLNQTIAAFFITRPPVAFLGSRWQDAMWSPLFELDAGEPAGLCVEAAPGVFERVWSRGTARLDCNAWAADLPFGVYGA